MTIYMDYNATTPILPEARAAIVDALDRAWGNPSSAHAAGRAAAEVLSRARAQVAAAVDVAPEQVVFTSGATEAINHVVQATGPGRVLVSAVEHPAVIEAVRLRPGRELELLPVSRTGRVDSDVVLQRVDAGPAPALVAIMAANNETGVLQPVGDLVAPLAARGVPFLVDASQLAGKLPVPFRPDYLVLAGHKLGATKGIGALVLRDGVAPPPLIVGGGQERGLRGGTEPIASIAGFGAAMSVVAATRSTEARRLARLRDRLERRLLVAMPGSEVVGIGAPRLPNTSCFMLPPGAQGAAMVAALDAEGVAISAGSACHAGGVRASRVLTSMAYTPDQAVRVIRVSLGPATTEAEVERVAELIPQLAAAP